MEWKMERGTKTDCKVSCPRTQVNVPGLEPGPLTLKSRARLFKAQLKEQCHEDFAVFGHFCAKIITLRF